MEAFYGVDVLLPAGNILLAPGEEYGLEYQLSSKMELIRSEVQDGVLYFQCRTRWPAALFFWGLNESFVRITYPAEAGLRAVRLQTTSGRIDACGLRTQSLWVKSISGSQGIRDVQADEISLETGSGSVEASGLVAGRLNGRFVSGGFHVEGGSLGGVEVKGTSGGIHLERVTADGLSCRTVSGSVTVEGTPRGEIDLQSGSGSVRMTSSLPSGEYGWELSSVSGGTKVNGEKAEICLRENAPNHVRARTTSGSVQLNFAK